MTIGVTGGIGAGKSTVTGILARQGVFVIDADIIAREVVLPGTLGLERLESAFGTKIVHEDGTLDRAALGRIVFSDSEKLMRLNEILHPLIFDRTKEIIKQKRAEGFGGIAALEAALLLDSRLAELTDENWVVYAPDDVRINRIIARNGCTEEQARSRLMSQPPQTALIMRADRTINSDCTLHELENEVIRTIGEMICEEKR